MTESRPRSVLVYSEIGAGGGTQKAVVILLHGYAGHQTDLVPLGRSLGGEVELVVPEAPRVLYFGRETMSHYWYIGEVEGRPDPPTFGDCLFQVEQFVYDTIDRSGGDIRPYLVGFDQGAVLALAAAKLIPDHLAGAVAICGYMPTIPGADLPARDFKGLPVLLVEDPDDASSDASLMARTAATLAVDGACVTRSPLPGARSLGDHVGAGVRTWLDDSVRARRDRHSA
jgi:phospholipase/carboxylesterase